MGEYVYLIAGLEVALEPKKFNCNQCAASYKEINKAAKRKPKGCYDYSTRVYKIENVLYKSCIGNYNNSMDFLLEAFSFYEKGMLPFKGTLAEQPAKIIDIFNIIEQRRNEKIKVKDGK